MVVGLPRLLAVVYSDEPEVHGQLQALLSACHHLTVVARTAEELQSLVAENSVGWILDSSSSVEVASVLLSCKAAPPLVRIIRGEHAPVHPQPGALHLTPTTTVAELQEALSLASLQPAKYQPTRSERTSVSHDEKWRAGGTTLFKQRDGRVDPTGRDEYLRVCASTGLVPSTRLLQHVAADSFSLRHAGIGSRGAVPLAGWISRNCTVSDLDCSHNRLGATGVAAVASALRSNSTLLRLNLSHNAAADERGRLPAELVTLLRNGCALTALDLQSNRLSDAGCSSVVDALAEATRMRKSRVQALRLGDNRAGHATARSLAALLNVEGSCVEELAIGHSELCAHAAVLLAGIPPKSPLRTLGLAWAGLEEAAACALGTLIGRNSTLTALDVSHNRIATAGAIVIARGLSVNTSLTNVDVSSNPLGQRGLAEIVCCGARLGRTLLVSHAQPTLPPPAVCSFDVNAPGGHYRLSLARPYDRWVAQNVMQAARRRPSGGYHAAKLDGAKLNGEDVTLQQLLKPKAGGAGGGVRGELCLDLSVPSPTTLMSSAVTLDLSDPNQRGLAYKMAADVRRCPEDAWADVTVSNLPINLSWAEDATLPERGVLKFSYCLSQVEPLPQPVQRVYTIELDRPRDFWLAGTLRHLAATRPDGFRWEAAWLNSIQIQTSPLPTGLPHQGTLHVDFRVSSAYRSVPSPPLKLTLLLGRSAHRAIGEQFALLRAASGDAAHPGLSPAGTVHRRWPSPSGPSASTALRDEGGGVDGVLEVAHVRSTLPWSPREGATLCAEAYEAVARAAHASAPKELIDTIAASASTAPLTAAQAVDVLDVTCRRHLHGAAYQPTHGRPVSAAGSRSAPGSRVGGPLAARARPSTAPASKVPRVPVPPPPRPPGSALEQSLERLISRLVSALAPLVILRERGTFLFSAWTRTTSSSLSPPPPCRASTAASPMTRASPKSDLDAPVVAGNPMTRRDVEHLRDTLQHSVGFWYLAGAPPRRPPSGTRRPGSGTQRPGCGSVSPVPTKAPPALRMECAAGSGGGTPDDEAADWPPDEWDENWDAEEDPMLPSGLIRNRDQSKHPMLNGPGLPNQLPRRKKPLFVVPTGQIGRFANTDEISRQERSPRQRNWVHHWQPGC